MKYLNRDTFQVGGYSRAYSNNWEAIFGAAKAKLDAEKAERAAVAEAIKARLDAEKAERADAAESAPDTEKNV